MYSDIIKGKTNVYIECDILYGTAFSFSADTLNDFKLGKEISQRERENLIIDEVDNMFIDCNNFITKLADRGHGMEEL